MTRGSEPGNRPRIYMVDDPWGPEGYPEDWLRARSGSRRRMFTFLRLYRRDDTVPERQFKRVRALRASGYDLWLDSGGFSFQRLAQRRRRDIDRTDSGRIAYLDAYARFLGAFGGLFEGYGNFDWCHDPAEVWNVQQELETRGIRPVPTIHDREGVEWMRRYIDAGHRYIAVGQGSRWGSRSRLLPYLDRLFDLAQKSGVRLHGYAMTGLPLLMRFPWHSVDSRSWIVWAGLGSICVPLQGRFTLLRVSGSAPGDYPWVAKLLASRNFDIGLMRPRGPGGVSSRARWERAAWNMYLLEHLWEFDVKPPGGPWGKWENLLD